MSYERPKRFVATTHRGGGGWLRVVCWSFVGIGAVTGGSALREPPAQHEQVDRCEPTSIPAGDTTSADLLIGAGWVDRTGTRTTIYPPGCEAH